MDKPKEGDLRIWWIPQVPGNPFYVPVSSLEEAKLIYDTLARYDDFQYQENIKSDYTSAGSLEVYENGEWTDWHDADHWTFDEWLEDQG